MAAPADNRGFAMREVDEGGRKRARIVDEGDDIPRANLAAGPEAFSRALEARARDEPPEVAAAIERLKSALRERKAGDPPPRAEVARLASAIRATTTQGQLAETAGNITRHRHEIRRRNLRVDSVEHLTPHMIRIVLTGKELDGFVSLSPDDHVKLVLESSGLDPAMREYTPRFYDAAARRLAIDFAIHDAGPATAWAEQAKPGDRMIIAGPRGSAVIAPVFDWWLLIGDETALPAMGRFAEEMAEGTQLVTLGAVPSDADRQEFATRARIAQHWVTRPVAQAAEIAPLLDAARGLVLPEGRGFIWIAAEAMVARALRDHFRDDRGHDPQAIKAAGYWVKGKADASDKSLDEAG